MRIKHKRIVELFNYNTRLMISEVSVPGHRFMSIGTFDGEVKWFVGRFSPSGQIVTFNVGSERYIRKVWKNFKNSDCVSPR